MTYRSTSYGRDDEDEKLGKEATEKYLSGIEKKVVSRGYRNLSRSSKRDLAEKLGVPVRQLDKIARHAYTKIEKYKAQKQAHRMTPQELEQLVNQTGPTYILIRDPDTGMFHIQQGYALMGSASASSLSSKIADFFRQMYGMPLSYAGGNVPAKPSNTPRDGVDHSLAKLYHRLFGPPQTS